MGIYQNIRRWCAGGLPHGNAGHANTDGCAQEPHDHKMRGKFHS